MNKLFILLITQMRFMPPREEAVFSGNLRGRTRTFTTIIGQSELTRILLKLATLFRVTKGHSGRNSRSQPHPGG